MIRWCMVPEIWSTVDRQTDGWMEGLKNLDTEVPHLKINIETIFTYDQQGLFNWRQHLEDIKKTTSSLPKINWHPDLTFPYVHSLLKIVLIKQIFEKNKSSRSAYQWPISQNTKLRYWFIALNTQRCGELKV